MSSALRKAIFSTGDALFNNSLVLSQKMDLEFILRDPIEGRRRTEAHLSSLLEHATSSTEYYRAWRGASYQQFPVVNKGSYRNDYESFLSDRFRNQRLHSMSTSGSTGTPFSVVQDRRKRSRVIAELKVFADRAGARAYQPMAFLRVLTARTRRSWLQQYGENLWRIDSPKLDEESFESFRRFIKRKRIKSLLSYPSTYDVFVDYLLHCGDSPEDFHVDSVISGGEVLLEMTRAKLKKVFGCRVFSRYSNNELGVMGQDTDENRDMLLNHGSYHFELLHPEKDEPVASGQQGRIVVTDLFNYALPIIRYDTGDIGSWREDATQSSCPSFSEVQGRQVDVLYDTNGSPVSPHLLSNGAACLKGVRQFQLVQETRDRYTLRINAKDLSGREEALAMCKSALGSDAMIEVVCVDEIPILKSGKRRTTVCNWKRSAQSNPDAQQKN